MSFASAASRHPDFARELRRFVYEARRVFTPDKIGVQLAQIERSQNERNVDVLEEDHLLREGPAAVAECVRQFTLVKKLLTAPMLVLRDRMANYFSMWRAALPQNRGHFRGDRKVSPS